MALDVTRLRIVEASMKSGLNLDLKHRPSAGHILPEGKLTTIETGPTSFRQIFSEAVDRLNSQNSISQKIKK